MYKIEPLVGQKVYKFANSLPSHPFKMLMCGKSPAGKTTVLISLLSKHFTYAKFYQGHNTKTRLFISCPTIKADKRWGPVLKRLKVPKEHNGNVGR